MRTLFLLFFLVSCFNCKADYIWSDKCLHAYDYTLRLNFVKAGQLIREEKRTNPQNQIPYYIESQIDFLQSFISENESSFETLKTQNDLRINQFQKHTFKSPYQQVCIAEMYIQIAIARIKFEEYLVAAYDIRKAYKILEQNKIKYPDFKPTLRGLGFIHAVVGTIPKNYSWAVSMLGLSGTIKQGLGELQELLIATNTQHELSYLKDETIVMLTFLEMNLKKERNEDKIRKWFYEVKDINEKPLLLFAKSVFHNSNAENDSIILLLGNRKKNPEAFELNYLDFMEGNARLHNLDYSASKYFQRYIGNYKGNSYKKTAWQRIAWIQLLQGDQEGYKQTMLKCLDIKKGEDFSDEDKQAIKDAKNGELPDISLLKSRLLFDGGYYNRAIVELAGKQVNQLKRLKDQLEYTYRLARIFDKQEKKEKAIQYYEQTIKNGADQQFYFAANSALLLGQLYEDKGDKQKAIEYYKRTLALRDHEYQNSIDQKAKAGLNRLED